MHRRVKPDSNEISCKHCGKRFRMISASHLWYRHGYDSDHPVKEYKEHFRLRFAHCRETLELIRENNEERVRRSGQRWTPIRFRTALRLLYKHIRAGEPYKSDPLLTRVGIKLYGSWPKAVRAAGIDYEKLTGRVLWTRDRVLREIRALGRSRQKGPAPIPSDLKGAAERRFGNWQNAVEAAGFDYASFTEGRKLMSPTALIAAIRKFARERKAHPHSAGRATGRHYEAAKRHFGSWEAAVRAANVDYEEFTGKQRWTPDLVVAEIQKLAERRRREPTGHPPFLHQAALRHFGSWEAAVRAAGFDRLGLIRLRWKRQAQART